MLVLNNSFTFSTVHVLVPLELERTLMEMKVGLGMGDDRENNTDPCVCYCHQFRDTINCVQSCNCRNLLFTAVDGKKLHCTHHTGCKLTESRIYHKVLSQKFFINDL